MLLYKNSVSDSPNDLEILVLSEIVSFCSRGERGVLSGRSLRQRLPQTETPWTETPWTETPLHRDPQTETPHSDHPRQRPPHMVMSGWYASYWNAFLFDISWFTLMVETLLAIIAKCLNSQISAHFNFFLQIAKT